MAKIIKIIENSFEGGVAGFGGTSNYSTGYGTPAGGNTTQDPSKFSSSDKTVSHFASDSTGSVAVPKMPDRPDVVSKSVMSTPDNTSPAANAEKQASETPLNPQHAYDGKVDQLFKGKKETPTPDEILQGMQYELGKMVKKDKAIAKVEVLKNLKKDPKYYSGLKMLNIDDKDMKVDESKDNSTFSKTKSVLDEMIKQRKDKSNAVNIANSKEISQIFKDLSNKRNSLRSK